MNKIVFTNVFVLIFLIGTAISFLINQFLEFVDYRARVKNDGTLPAELKKIPESSLFNAEKLKNISNYENAKYFLYIPNSVVEMALTIFLVCSGFYPYIFNFVCRLTSFPQNFGNTFFCAFLFSFICTIPENVFSLPFNIYQEFHIEKKFGFSNMTVKMWLIDEIKSFAISFVMSLILMLLIIGVLFIFKSSWWIFVTCVILAFSLIMQVIYPLFIAPIFNKFTPLEDGELKTKITNLMQNMGFKSTGIFIVDSSKRSNHSNAYFTGIGKSKRVVLYDTLVNQLTTDELVAVLAHEFGHYKLHHITKRMCYLVPVVFLLMLLLYKVAQFPALYTGFGFAIEENLIVNVQFIGLMLASLVIGALQEIFSPILNFFSRKDEYAADAFAKKLTGTSDALISGLIKLNSENLSELLPPKIYVIWNYSHPTLVERIIALKK